MNRSIGKLVSSAATGFFIITLSAKALGYIEKLILSYYWGTGIQVDVYQTVFTLVTGVFLFTRESTEPGLLNFFVRSKETRPLQTKGVYTTLFMIILAFSLLITLPAILFPQRVIGLFAPGFSGEKKILAIRFTGISFVGVIFYCLSSLSGTKLIASKRFNSSAAGDVVLKLILVASIVIAARNKAPLLLAWGIVAGCAGRLLIHWVALGNQFTFRQPGPAKKEDLRGIWKMTWPLFFGLSFSQLTLTVYNFIGSYLPNGSIAALGYAKKTAEMPVILFPYILSIILFPFFSELFAKGDKQAASQLLARTCRIILLVFLPLSLLACIYSSEIIGLLYHRGAFDQRSVALTALAFRIYAAGMVFMALETVLVVFFYAAGDTLTPVITGIVFAAGSMIMAIALTPSLGLSAIALSFVADRVCKNLTFLFLLNRRKSIKLCTFLSAQPAR